MLPADLERVIYQHNPLDAVICQVRFPTILKIDTEVPSAFQERLSTEYVDVVENHEVLFAFQIGGKPVAQRDEAGQVNPVGMRNYGFLSEDHKWTVNLTRNFLSLSIAPGSYVRWEDFIAKFETMLDMFIEVYKPVVFTRIGLRYVDVFVRSKLNLPGVDWAELIAPPLLGVLGSVELKKDVKQLQSIFVMGLQDDESEVRVSASTAKSAESDETCFVIDSDYYDLRRRKPEEVLARLNVFHSQAFGLFRWCITDKLHEAMEPSKIQ